MHGNIKHGHSRKGKRTAIYSVWLGMKRRCESSRSRSYKWYGARGIKVCERWRDFSNFLADMGWRPEGYWIERIDNDKGYEPGNCKWATPTENVQNSRPRTRRCTDEEIRARKNERRERRRRERLREDAVYRRHYLDLKAAAARAYRRRQRGVEVELELGGL